MLASLDWPICKSTKWPHGCTCAHALRRYFARGGWDASTSAGMRPPTPPQTDWNVYPKRLALHKDPTVRLQFSHWNTAMCEWAASDWSDDVRANMPRAHMYKYADAKWLSRGGR